MNRVGNLVHILAASALGADRKERNFTFAQIKVDPGRSHGSTLLTAMIKRGFSGRSRATTSNLSARHRCGTASDSPRARSVARGLRNSRWQNFHRARATSSPARHPAPAGTADEIAHWVAGG